MYLHALHTMHALPKLRVAGGRRSKPASGKVGRRQRLQGHEQA